MSRIVYVLVILTLLEFTDSVAQQLEWREVRSDRVGTCKIWLSSSHSESNDSNTAMYYRIVEYKSGLPTGSFTEYYKTGERYREGVIQADRFYAYVHGVVKIYRRLGPIEEIITYERGQKSGEYKKLADNGTATAIGLYESDKRVGEWATFYSDGKPKSHGSYVDNQKNGEWINYSPDGTITSKNLYSNGRELNLSTLISQADEALRKGRTSDAERYCDEAEKTGQLKEKGNELFSARWYMVNASIEVIKQNHINAQRYFDSAAVIYSGNAAGSRRAMLLAYQLLLPIARVNKCKPILSRFDAELNRLIRTNKQEGVDEFMFTSMILMAVSDDDEFTIQFENVIDWCIKQDEGLDSAIKKERSDELFEYWRDAMHVSSIRKAESEHSICFEHAKYYSARLSKSNTDQIVFNCEYRLQRMVFESKDQVTVSKKHVLSMLVSDSIMNNPNSCRLAYEAVRTATTLQDRVFCKQLRTTAEKLCDKENSLDLVYVYMDFSTMYASEGNCDSARALADRAEQLRTKYVMPKAAVDSWRKRIADCGSEVVANLPSTLPGLFVSDPDTTVITRDEALEHFFGSGYQVIVNGIRSQASSTEKLRAVLFTDTTVTAPPNDHAMNAYQEMLGRAGSYCRQAHNDLDRGNLLFRFIHDTILKKYESMASVHELFKNGTYNCASAVILYSLMGSELGLNVHYYDAPGHILCGVVADGKTILVEMTDPATGYGFDKERDSLCDHLLKYKLISAEEVEEYGRDSVFNRYSNMRQFSNFGRVIGGVIANRIVRSFDYRKVFDTDEYQRGLALALLDSGDVTSMSGELYHYRWADSSVKENILVDLTVLASYFHKDSVFYSALEDHLIELAAGCTTTAVASNCARLFDQVMYHAPWEQDTSINRRTLIWGMAFVKAKKAAIHREFDTAYALIVKYIPDTLKPRIPDVYQITFDYIVANWFTQPVENSVRIVVNDYQRDQNENSTQFMISVLRSAFMSPWVEQVDSLRYTELGRMLFKEFILTKPNFSDQEYLLKNAFEQVMFRDRVGLGNWLVQEAASYKYDPELLRRMSQVLSVVRQNADRSIPTESIVVKHTFHIGSSDGPTTLKIPTETDQTHLKLNLTQMELGQRFTIKAELTMPDGNRVDLLYMNFLAVSSEWNVWQVIPRLNRSQKGKGQLRVMLNDTEAYRRDVESW